MDEKMLHLTAKLERQFAESAKLEAMILENLRGWVLADSSSIAEDYHDFWRELKEGIVQYQVRAVLFRPRSAIARIRESFSRSHPRFFARVECGICLKSIN